MIFNCDKCDYKTTLNGELTRHTQSKHEGVHYSCDQCNYKATRQSSVARHKQSKHEGVHYDYDYDQCDYKAIH